MGYGNPQREFIHVDDFISAMIFTMENIDAKQIYTKGISHINVSSGDEVSIRDLAFMVKKITRYQGDINFDNSMPDGTPRKVLDGAFLNQLNWCSKIQLEEGLKATYLWYKKINHRNDFLITLTGLYIYEFIGHRRRRLYRIPHCT